MSFFFFLPQARAFTSSQQCYTGSKVGTLECHKNFQKHATNSQLSSLDFSIWALRTQLEAPEYSLCIFSKAQKGKVCHHCFLTPHTKKHGQCCQLTWLSPSCSREDGGRASGYTSSVASAESPVGRSACQLSWTSLYSVWEIASGRELTKFTLDYPDDISNVLLASITPKASV